MGNPWFYFGYRRRESLAVVVINWILIFSSSAPGSPVIYTVVAVVNVR